MFLFKKATLFIAVLMLMLTACGGNGSNNDDNNIESCVVGVSNIGACRL